MRARVLYLLLATVLVAAVAASSLSGARFTAKTANAGNTVNTDRTSSYLHAYSQSTNPGGLTGYATRRNSSPVVPAATGTDDALTVNLGGYNNANGNLSRVFTITTPATLPAGLTSITVTLSIAADPATGIQPITDYNIATTTNTVLGKSVAIPANTTRQINLKTSTSSLAGNLQYIPKVVVQATYAGYTRGFLSYVVPIKIYDGNGAGPN